MSSSVSLVSLKNIPKEHPQPVDKVSLLKWLIQWNPKDSLSKAIHLLLISSPLQMLSNLFLPSPQGLDEWMCALSYATSIFGNFMRYVRGGRRLMGAGGCRSLMVSLCRSMAGSQYRSMLKWVRLKSGDDAEGDSTVASNIAGVAGPNQVTAAESEATSNHDSDVSKENRGKETYQGVPTEELRELLDFECSTEECRGLREIAFEGLARMHGLMSYQCSEEFDRYTATEFRLEPGCYVATEQDERSVAT
ncbi:hypothetical protein F2Q69_00053140 [Brassica cretica]|uniref:Uncharacterized protein n=1 Tax=Brassica cretica TaxID=69181 RepID=A0A8S9NAB7_BRACR|nr:hypothetical protein F2Q69_00053140 [Brassica cretica]